MEQMEMNMPDMYRCCIVYLRLSKDDMEEGRYVVVVEMTGEMDAEMPLAIILEKETG